MKYRVVYDSRLSFPYWVERRSWFCWSPVDGFYTLDEAREWIEARINRQKDGVVVYET